MFRPWQRILGGIAACCGALLLAGCEISGTVEVHSDSEVVANLIVTKAEADCLGLTEFAGLVVKGTPDPDGDQLCRANGIVDLAELKDYGVEVSRLGEYLMVDLALPRRIRDMPISIDITFPGPVVTAGDTTASGNQVTLTEGVGVANSGPTRVIAMSHAGPQWWVLGLTAGFVVGVGLTLAFVLVLRRRRLRSRPATPAATVREPDDDAWFAPPSSGAMPPASAEPVPPGRVPGPEQATDHRIWAPPADQGDR
ncbi:MAG: hypothetical protein ACOH1Y_06605 [Propionicimonas sp.]